VNLERALIAATLWSNRVGQLHSLAHALRWPNQDMVSHEKVADILDQIADDIAAEIDTELPKEDDT